MKKILLKGQYFELTESSDYTGRIQILVLTNCPGNWYWNWYWLIKNIEKLLFFHLNIFPSIFAVISDIL